MALVQHRQIKDRIENEFAPHLDMSDVESDENNNCLLSRGLCALSLSHLADVDVATACKSITDGFNDNGIDGVLYEPTDKTLYLVQSKWNNTHTGGVDNGGVLKFLQGVKDLLNSRYEKFNAKFQKRRSELDRAITSASKVVVAVAYSGSASFGEENRSSMEDFISDVDETKELVSYVSINQNHLYSHILMGAQGAAVSDTLNIFHWGYLDEPVRAYYGQVSASDLAQMHRKYGHKLFSKNIRMFLGSEGAVNRNIIETINGAPEHFWYFNNGITALANTVVRKAIGGSNRDSGQFECEGLTIVNGAQTVGSLSAIAEKSPQKLSDAKVLIRIISLDGAPDGFAPSITRNNNTQNRIDPRNFVALDPTQERLKSEFLVDNIDYEYRQGEIEHSSATRLGLMEATLALACTDDDVNLSTQAKREVGRLWEDIERPPYKKLFHSGISSEQIWKRVLAFRRIEQAISALTVTSGGKDRNVAIHGNRFLTHLTYHSLTNKASQQGLEGLTAAEIDDAVRTNFSAMTTDILQHYPDNYIASLFKNQTKCREMKTRLVQGGIAA